MRRPPFRVNSPQPGRSRGPKRSGSVSIFPPPARAAQPSQAGACEVGAYQVPVDSEVPPAFEGLGMARIPPPLTPTDPPGREPACLRAGTLTASSPGR